MAAKKQTEVADWKWKDRLVRGKEGRLLLSAYIVLLIAAAVIPYVFALHGEFVADDQDLILRDSDVHSLRGIPAAFTKGFLAGVGSDRYYYRPLITASYTLNYALCGTDSDGYRFINILLHGLVTLLVFALARRIVPTGPALAGALLFAVHPAHTEAVAWISGRTEVLAAVFAVGAIVAFCKYAQEKRRGWYAASLALFLAALLSKENTVVVPVLIALFVLILMPRRGLGRLVRELLPFVAVILAYLLVRRLVLGYVLNRPVEMPFQHPWYLTPVTVFEYLRILMLPSRAEPTYDIFGSAVRMPALIGLGWAGMGALFAGAIVLRRRWPAAAFGSLWTLLAILPVSNLVPILGPLPAERFLYLPSVGFSLLFGLAAGWVMSVRPRPLRHVWPLATGAAAAGFLAYCAMQTYSGAPLWSNSMALRIRQVQRGPRFETIRMAAAVTFERHGELDMAVREYKAAIRLVPKAAPPHLKLAVLYRRMDRPADAAREARILVDLLPDDCASHFVLGSALADAGDLTGAIRALRRAIELAPDDPAIRFNLAHAYARNRDYPRAVEQYRCGLARRPDYERARYELGLALRSAGRLREARAQLRAVVEGRGDYALRASSALSAMKGNDRP